MYVIKPLWGVNIKKAADIDGFRFASPGIEHSQLGQRRRATPIVLATASPWLLYEASSNQS
jgi:hypothetical protein